MLVWHPLKNYEKLYAINESGEIKTLPKKIGKGKGYIKQSIILNQHLCKEGYLKVRLSKNNSYKNLSAHRLVAIQFIKNPKNKPQVNHKNGIKTDNRKDNLEWATRSENMSHAVKLGLHYGSKGEENVNSKLSEKDVIEIRKIGKSKTQNELGILYGVDRRHIGRILNNKRWKHIKN